MNPHYFDDNAKRLSVGAHALAGAFEKVHGQPLRSNHEFISGHEDGTHGGVLEFSVLSNPNPHLIGRVIIGVEQLDYLDTVPPDFVQLVLPTVRKTTLLEFLRSDEFRQLALQLMERRRQEEAEQVFYPDSHAPIWRAFTEKARREVEEHMKSLPDSQAFETDEYRNVDLEEPFFIDLREDEAA